MAFTESGVSTMVLHLLQDQHLFFNKYEFLYL